MFVGAISDNFDERIEQKIFHAEIVVDNAMIAAETKAYQKIPDFKKFEDGDGNDNMKEQIEQNYFRIKEETDMIVKTELKKLKDDPKYKDLFKK